MYKLGIMEKEKDPAAVSLGRRGGLAKARKLTKEQLSEVNRKAVQARWAKRKPRSAEEESHPSSKGSGAGGE